MRRGWSLATEGMINATVYLDMHKINYTPVNANPEQTEMTVKANIKVD